ncbi:MAG: S8 family serine peptidase [Candidatus Sumerlaeota bacterium]|nr:S8 family serine peptidase [Candidatus Sumerlaeota bacterium]
MRVRNVGLALCLCISIPVRAAEKKPLENLFDRGKAQPTAAAAPARQEVPRQGKLVDPEKILSVFSRDATQRAGVIVTLRKPETLARGGDWNSRDFVKSVKNEVAAKQDSIIKALPKGECKALMKFPLQAAFSAQVSMKGLEALEDQAEVQTIEPLREYEHFLRQGLAMIHDMPVRPKYTGKGVAIAIVDSGIDYKHSALGGAGFPNDKVKGGYDFGDNDADPHDDAIGHGTGVAGIAAGLDTEHADYIGGVAPDAKLYALKVFTNGQETFTDDKMIAAWNWIVEHKNDDPQNPILVVNNSLGGGRAFQNCDDLLPAVADAAKMLDAAGIACLAAAGNNGFCESLASPACIKELISVGAVYDADIGKVKFVIDPASCFQNKQADPQSPTGYTATEDAKAKVPTCYSNTASMLDIFAPSNSATAPDILGTAGFQAGDWWEAAPGFGGTSAACPYAAGAVACLQQAAKEAKGKYLTPAEVRGILASTGESVTDPKASIAKPLINLEAAVAKATGEAPPPPPTPSPSPAPGGGEPTPTATPTATPTPQPGAGGLLTLLSPIRITDQSGQQEFPSVQPNQEAFLTVLAHCGEAPLGTAPMLLALWTFYDAQGRWLKERTQAAPYEATPGDAGYQLRYKAPAGATGEYAVFTLFMPDQATGQMLDQVGALRPIQIGQGGQSFGKGPGALTRSQADAKQAAALRDLAKAYSAFRERTGQGGLRVSINAQRDGDRVKFLLKADKDCEAVLLDQSSNGKLALLPGKGKTLQLKAGKETEFPAGGAGFALSGPRGEELVAVLALRQAPKFDASDPAAAAAAWVGAGSATASATLNIDKGEPETMRRIAPPKGSEAAPTPKPEKGKGSLEGLFKK